MCTQTQNYFEKFNLSGQMTRGRSALLMLVRTIIDNEIAIATAPATDCGDDCGNFFANF